MQAGRGDAAGAFETSERLRAGRTLATLSGGRTEYPAGDPSELRSREQDLRRRMAALTAELYATAEAPPALREPVVARSAPDLEAALYRTQDEYARVIGLIRETDARYADLVAPDLAPLDEVGSRLSPDEVFVEYLVTDSSTLAVVITAESSDALTLNIGREQLADLIFFARGAIEQQRTGSGADLWVAPLRRLHAELIAPLEAGGWLEGKSTLLVAPHAELHYLPFQALIASQGEIEFLIETSARSGTRRPPPCGCACPIAPGSVRAMRCWPWPRETMTCPDRATRCERSPGFSTERC